MPHVNDGEVKCLACGRGLDRSDVNCYACGSTKLDRSKVTGTGTRQGEINWEELAGKQAEAALAQARQALVPFEGGISFPVKPISLSSLIHGHKVYFSKNRTWWEVCSDSTCPICSTRGCTYLDCPACAQKQVP